MALLLGAAHRGGLAAGDAGGAAGRVLHPRPGQLPALGRRRAGALLRRPRRVRRATSGRRSSSRSPWPRCRALVSSVLAVDERRAVLPPRPPAGRPARRRRRRRPPGVLFLQIDALGLRHRPPRRPRRVDAEPRRLAARGQPHDDLLAHRLELADRRRGAAASCTAPTTTSSGSAGTRRTATTSPASRTRSTPRRSSGGTPTAAACWPATAPAAATCSPATPRTSA